MQPNANGTHENISCPNMMGGLVPKILGWIAIILCPSNSEGTYRRLYERWKEPVFHWLLKREHENKEVPSALHKLAWEKLLLYRQIETETGYEYY